MHRFVRNVRVAVVLKMSSIFYSDVQHTSQHLRAKNPCGFGDAMPDGTTLSEQLRLLYIFDCDQQAQLAQVVYTRLCSETTACHCHMAAI
jgi:hypothetical protein